MACDVQQEGHGLILQASDGPNLCVHRLANHSTDKGEY